MNSVESWKAVESVLADVRLERDAQDVKWGRQDHSNAMWMLILTEEVGELAKEILERNLSNDTFVSTNLRKELVQVAAVAVAWLECLDRNNPNRSS